MKICLKLIIVNKKKFVEFGLKVYKFVVIVKFYFLYEIFFVIFFY